LKGDKSGGKARGISFGLLFSAIARNPSTFDKLDEAAAKFLGPYHSDYISDELLDITKTYAIDALLESISRQPEADSLLNLASKKYLNFEIHADLD
jgi:F0F1-type ATP synthase membrane subunit c/vacuolar-type H+-ATPase subunit K